MNLKIIEINHIAINVADLDISARFYGELLGLKHLPRPAFGFPGSWFAIGNQELHLILNKEHTEPDRSHHHFAILVENVFVIRDELIRKGYTNMQEVKRRPDGALQLFITDPDNYVIEFCAYQ